MLKRTSLLLLGLTLVSPVVHATDDAPREEDPSPPNIATENATAVQPANEQTGGASQSPEPRAERFPSRPDVSAARDAQRGNRHAGESANVGAQRSPRRATSSHVDEISPIDGDETTNRSDEGRFRILLQLRYRYSRAETSSLSDQPDIEREQRGSLKSQDGYDIQRAFLRHTSRPVRELETKLLLDFAELRHGQPRQSFKLAYLQLHATRRLEFAVGLMKRTYSLLELLPIVDHELADLGPTDAFIKDQGYGGRDVGFIVRYSPLSKRRWLTASVGTFRGDIDEGYDASPLKLVTARIESFPWKHLRLGISGSYRPYKNVEVQRLTNPETGAKYYSEVTTLDPGKAMGLDATLLFKHIQFRTEVLYGDRTNPKRVGSDHFAAGYAVIAARFRLGGLDFVPAGKLERLDLNPESAGGARTLMTTVVGVVPLEGLRIIGDLTYTHVDRGLTFMDRVPWTSAKSAVYALEPNSTAVTVQVQYHH